MNALVDMWGFWGFHAAWQAAIVSAVVLAVVWLGRRWPAPIRYGLLLVALAKFALPPILALPTGALSHWGPAVSAEQQEVVESGPVVARTIAYESHSAGLERPVHEDVPPEFAATPIEPAEIQPMPSPPATAAVDRAWNWKAVLFALHLSGMAIVGTWLVTQWIRLQRLRVSAHEIPDEQIQQRFAVLSKQLGMRRTVRLLAGSEDTVPCSFGLLRPVVVVPESLAEEPSKDLDRVLAHELAHHRRGDLWVNAAQLVLFAVWWFHPLYWLLHRSLRAVREDCCDDLLLAKGIASPGEYCDTILRVASNQKSTSPLAIASSMADYPHPLEKRFRRIMDGSLKRSVRLGWLGLAAVVVMAVVLLPGARGSGEAVSSAMPAETEMEASPDSQAAPATLSGRVVTASGEAVENATVTFPDWGDNPPLSRSQTNADGSFLLVVRKGENLPHRRSHPLQIAAEGYATAYVDERHLTLIPGVNRDLGEIRLYPGLIFRGRVVDSAGSPIAGAKVTCTTYRFELGHTTAGVGLPYETATDSDGRYETQRMPLGYRCVLIQAEGFLFKALLGEDFAASDADGQLPLVQLLPDFPIQGEVCDAEGKPIEGAEINAGGVCSTHSDRNGRFVLRGFDEYPRFQFRANMPGYAFINWGVKGTPDGIEYHVVGESPDGAELDAEEYQKAMDAITVRMPKLIIRMKREAHITGRAIDADTGEPVTLSRIVICTFTRKPDGEVVLDGCRNSRFEQPEPGAFRFGYTYPTEFHLTLSADGYEDAESFTPPVTSLEEIEGLVVKMKRKGRAEPALPTFQQRVHGTVRQKNQILRGARIALWQLPGTPNAENAWILRGRTTTGDGWVIRSQPLQNGAFDLEVPHQSDAWYLLVETPQGVCALEGPLTIGKGENKALEIETRRAGTIRGRVTNFSDDSPKDLWVVAFSKYGLQYETPVAKDGTFSMENVYPGEYGLKVGCDAIRDSEVPLDQLNGMSEEERYEMGRAPSQPWKRAVRVSIESGRIREGVELEFDP